MQRPGAAAAQARRAPTPARTITPGTHENTGTWVSVPRRPTRSTRGRPAPLTTGWAIYAGGVTGIPVDHERSPWLNHSLLRQVNDQTKGNEYGCVWLVLGLGAVLRSSPGPRGAACCGSTRATAVGRWEEFNSSTAAPRAEDLGAPDFNGYCEAPAEPRRPTSAQINCAAADGWAVTAGFRRGPSRDGLPGRYFRCCWRGTRGWPWLPDGHRPGSAAGQPEAAGRAA